MSDVCRNDGAPDQPTEAAESSVFAPGPGKHVLFFGDPMCSWCWGFAPELKKLADQAQGHAAFHVVMGGLRPGTVQAWDEGMRRYIRHHWEDVAAKTGQPFDFTRFDDHDFVYDTEPGCRAVVAVRECAAEHTLAAYEALQQGFYAENRNITDVDVLADLVASAGVDREQFIRTYSAPGARKMVAFDFQRTQAFGVQGFPSVLCAEDGQYAFLTLGYRTYAAMQGDFMAWLDS